MRKMISKAAQLGFAAGLFGALAMNSAGVEHKGYAWALMWVSIGFLVLTVSPKELKPPS